MKAQPWKTCREPSQEEIPADIDSVIPLPFVGCTIVNAMGVWNKEGTMLDNEAFKNLICELDDGMDALWGKEYVRQQD